MLEVAATFGGLSASSNHAYSGCRLTRTWRGGEERDKRREHLEPRHWRSGQLARPTVRTHPFHPDRPPATSIAHRALIAAFFRAVDPTGIHGLRVSRDQSPPEENP